MEAIMKHTLLFASALAAILLLILLASARPAQADSAEAASFSISWWTVDAGGGVSTATGFSLNGTAGQPDAGSLTSAAFSLSGGFWGGQPGLLNPMFLPFVRR
jgi:hypothetical protein